MGRPNYQYKKRQKEIARMKKREQKRQRKVNKNNPDAQVNPESQESNQEPLPE